VKKESRLKALWSVRLANRLSELPAFDRVLREFRRALRQSDLLWGACAVVTSPTNALPGLAWAEG
jgi:hypothetical protein